MKNQIKTLILLGSLSALIAVGALVTPGYLYLFGVLALAMNLGGSTKDEQTSNNSRSQGSWAFSVFRWSSLLVNSPPVRVHATAES